MVSRAQQAVFVEPGRYEIEIALTGKVLDLRKEDMRSVQQYYRGNVNNQQWNIESAGGNSYYIRSAENGGYLSVENAREGGRVVVTNSARSGDTWGFVDLGNGSMMIVHRSGMTLDITGGDTRDGTPIQVWSQARNTHQQFRLVRLNANAAYSPNTTSRTESNESYRMGVDDRAANLGRNYRRHRELYDRYSEREFEQSYNAGYDSGRNTSVYNNDLNRMSANERRVYDEAYQLGQQDARSSYGANYRRYSDRYNRLQESLFQRGYEAGYNSSGRSDRFDNNRDNNQFDLSRLTPNERSAYDDGYRIGQRDARAGSTLNYRRYSDRYTFRQESFFQRGYEVGYNSVRRY